MVNVEQLPRAERKHHTLVVFLQLIVDLCGDESRKFSLGERLILVELLTARVSMCIDDCMDLNRTLKALTFD